MQNKINQSGRSMVEMLGVLAIIGVLSVGGIAGYTTAMNKHRANEILNAASVRAVVVSTKLQQNSTADITNALAEFGNETIAGASFTAVSASGNTFTLTLSGVSSEACAQIKNIVGENGNVIINDGCTTFTYNTDLSNGVSTGPAIQEDQEVTACTRANSNTYKWNDDTLKQYTGDNTDEKVGSSYCRCHKDTPIWDGTGCVAASTKVCNSSKPCDSGEYCNYNEIISISLGYSNNGYPLDNNGTEGNGVCEKVAGVKKVGQFYYTRKSMDWFSAKNWCEALPGNHTMVKMSTLTAPPFNCNFGDKACNYDSFREIGLTDYYWTGSCHGTNSDCGDSDESAWAVMVADDYFKTDNRMNFPGSALCE